MAFLDLRKNFGAETERARDLFLAVWISDLFMKQVESDGDWYLMCPDKCPGLTDVYGDEYDKLYWQYVHENKFNKKIKARDVMKAILDSQLETGTPYIGFKDNVNNKSNQKNIGVIKSSNLCCEITEVSNSSRYSVCNLASIALPRYIVIPTGKVREKDKKLTGMLLAIKSPFMWDANKLIMSEIAYWVEPEYRGSTAGYRLLAKYVEYCDKLKDDGVIVNYTMSQMAGQDLDYTRFGLKPVETTWSI
jgi:ribonucleotide reductase alpha subunit